MKTASSLILSQSATRVVEVCKKPSLDTDSEVSHVPVRATFVQLFLHFSGKSSHKAADV